ncbi:MAG: PDDEXK nuclease domain-containing protein [Lachnospiraceae bacterium]|nr:PDDEXK nuclease domain-containing protein [Lachnospiraceae bacterium]
MKDFEIMEYKLLVDEVKELIHKKQYKVLKAINSETINLYWEIGEEIYRQQEENGWGKSIVQVLSKELQKEFPGAKGYSAANLWRMRNFYLSYHNSEKLAPLVREISWSNNIIIMEKCKDDLQREFYIQMTKRYGWTKRILANFVEAQTYEKYLLNQTNFDMTLPKERRIQAKLAVKDEYTFDFAELSPEYSEYELEMQLVNNIRAFLIEMGGDFTFIGNQYHLTVGSRDLYIDLLLFHRRLRSLVAIELKIGEFEAEYAGKMQLYLTALDEQVKLADENPSIGIIICKTKDKTYVEYALKQTNAPIGVATYQLSNSLPENMKEMLPEPEEIVKKLRIFEET